jgi:transposase InsO family protein
MELGLSASVGRVGTAHDNALIESTIGLYKAELGYRPPVEFEMEYIQACGQKG